MKLDIIKNKLNNFIILDNEDKKVTEYINVKCKKCNKIEKHLLSNLLQGYGCRTCGSKKKYNFFEKIPKEFDYDLSETVYVNKRTKIKYICKKHGLQEQFPQIFLKSGCPKCSRENGVKKRENCKPISLEEFIKKAKLKHGNKYDYSLVDYKNKFSHIKIICPIHGVFEQEARVHSQGHGCPFCNTSKGENIISIWLKNKNIKFSKTKEYENLKDKDLLSYDFYIENKNLLIEYNGEQHYKNVFNKPLHEWHRQLHHDWLKRKYAKKNGITLLVIPYWDFKNIDTILEENISLKRNL